MTAFNPETLRWPAAYAEATIAAPREQVWAILTDFAAYDTWNPFTYAVEMPRFAVGEEFAFTTRMKSSERFQREIITVIDPPDCLAWAYARNSIFLSAVRYQQLTATANGGTHYQTWEQFNGLIAPLIGWTVLGAVQAGFDDVAAALKASAETG